MDLLNTVEKMHSHLQTQPTIVVQTLLHTVGKVWVILCSSLPSFSFIMCFWPCTPACPTATFTRHRRNLPSTNPGYGPATYTQT